MLINLGSLKTAETLDQLNEHFKAICNEQGIESFAIAELSLSRGEQTKFAAYSTYPIEWANQYITGGYYERDPVFTNPAEIPLPFYWDKCSFKNMTCDQKRLFNDAYDFGIRAGTTITLRPRDGVQRYLTLLDCNLTNNFNCMFWLRSAGEEYFNKKKKLRANCDYS